VDGLDWDRPKYLLEHILTELEDMLQMDPFVVFAVDANVDITMNGLSLLTLHFRYSSGLLSTGYIARP
jgi:hypothetical protein